ncbi:hypothetical protein COO60DRAFT_575495 [Scenedesmus sp. NREL 46B-D3]|nr:hypothetical protein COO60DRAFT_575495 [Scenedesmus sp. NREL 46B-D3]
MTYSSSSSVASSILVLKCAAAVQVSAALRWCCHLAMATSLCPAAAASWCHLLKEAPSWDWPEGVPASQPASRTQKLQHVFAAVNLNDAPQATLPQVCCCELGCGLTSPPAAPDVMSLLQACGCELDSELASQGFDPPWWAQGRPEQPRQHVQAAAAAAVRVCSRPLTCCAGSTCSTLIDSVL